MDASVGSHRMGGGAFEPSERDDDADISVIVENAPFDDVSSQHFFDARSTDQDDKLFGPAGTSTTVSSSSRSKKSPRRSSDVGSIPLKSHSLEIINGLAPGEPLPGMGKNDSASFSAVSQEHAESVKTHETIDFLQDDPADMTNGRRIALYMMKRYKWYNPQLIEGDEKHQTDVVIDEGRFRSQDGYPILHSKEETPSLEKAWAYFDHVALPRYLYEPKANNEKKSCLTRCKNKWNKGDKQLARAEPGDDENETRLYSPIFTPHKQLGDFGLGIGLYFSTVRALTVLCLVAGLIHIPNFIYFSGEDYSNNQPEVPSLLQGSAICTETAWVPCPDCHDKEDQFSENSWLQDPIRNATFARKNLCDGATIEQGMVNYTALWFVVVAAFGLYRYLHRMEVQFDEDEQTAQDYSIAINNPPDDATDPVEWRDFFFKAFGAHVTGCTVAVDNDLLVRTLAERREKMRQLELLVEPGTKLDIVTLAGIAAAKERERTALQRFMALMSPGIPEIFSRMAVLTAKVQGLAQQDYPVTNVFITFETEADQRNVLEKLSVGQASVDANRQSSVRDANYLFRGFRVLSVIEPEEPDSIRWEDLNVSMSDRLKQQFFTALATVAALALVAFIVAVVNDSEHTALTAYIIAIANAIFPMFAKALTYNEAHPSHGSLQTSLYFKIAIFRWVTTAIIITIITPFGDTLQVEGLIQQIQAQFFAEVTTTSAIQLADPVGHFQRHFLAPRATTQDAMNLCMQGSKFELAERYTATAKLLFLTFWYCSIYPGVFFWCAFALQVIYYLDKLSLTRTWKRVPRLGATISQFNRSYFLPLSIVAMAVLSSYYWSGFPFDNLCPNDNTTAPTNYVGDIVILVEEADTVADYIAAVTGNRTPPAIADPNYVNFTIDPNNITYHFCDQDLLRPPGGFPFVPEWQQDGQVWMTEEQELVTNIYGWSALGFLAAFVVIVIFKVVYSFCGYFHGSYVPTGDDQGQNFSDLEAINLYIPQVESAFFSYPLLACSVDNIDEDMLDWTDPDHPHAFYDLTKDAQALIRGSDISEKVVFSQVQHWENGWSPTAGESSDGSGRKRL